MKVGKVASYDNPFKESVMSNDQRNPYPPVTYNASDGMNLPSKSNSDLDELDELDDLDVVDDNSERSANPDPITGARGAHPVGVGVGSAAAGASGAVAGAAIGSIVPGVGTAIGAVVGAVAGAIGGGYAGKAVAESVNPTFEDSYWREQYPNRGYADRQARYTYDIDYKDAYRFAYAAAEKYDGSEFEAVEPKLIEDWSKQHGMSRLEWSIARAPILDAWNHYREHRPEPQVTR